MTHCLVNWVSVGLVSKVPHDLLLQSEECQIPKKTRPGVFFFSVLKAGEVVFAFYS